MDPRHRTGALGGTFSSPLGAFRPRSQPSLPPLFLPNGMLAPVGAGLRDIAIGQYGARPAAETRQPYTGTPGFGEPILQDAPTASLPGGSPYTDFGKPLSPPPVSEGMPIVPQTMDQRQALQASPLPAPQRTPAVGRPDVPTPTAESPSRLGEAVRKAAEFYGIETADPRSVTVPLPTQPLANQIDPPVADTGEYSGYRAQPVAAGASPHVADGGSPQMAPTPASAGGYQHPAVKAGMRLERREPAPSAPPQVNPPQATPPGYPAPHPKERPNVAGAPAAPTAPAVDPYMTAVLKSANAIPGRGAALTPDDKNMAMLQAGLATMAAASQPGATALGALGQGGLAGVEEARRIKAADRSARLDEFNKNVAIMKLSTDRQDAADRLELSRAELAERVRTNRASEGAQGKIMKAQLQLAKKDVELAMAKFKAEGGLKTETDIWNLAKKMADADESSWAEDKFDIMSGQPVRDSDKHSKNTQKYAKQLGSKQPVGPGGGPAATPQQQRGAGQPQPTLASAGGTPQQSQGQYPAPQTQAEFDALPKGTVFIDPGNGEKYTKE